MLMKIKNITDEQKNYFQKFYTKHNVVGLLEDEYRTIIIVKMKQGQKGWTPTGCARDCGDHYIIARYSSYDRLDKKTLQLTKNVEDR